MNIESRIERLKELLGADEGCPECGWGGDGRVKVRIHDHGEYEGPEACPECGRGLQFTLNIGPDVHGEEEEEE